MPAPRCVPRSGRLLVLDDAGLDLDLPGLLGLGQLAYQVDGQQPVDQVGRVGADVLGELKAALERAPGNAAVEILDAIGVVRRLFGIDRPSRKSRASGGLLFLCCRFQTMSSSSFKPKAIEARTATTMRSSPQL